MKKNVFEKYKVICPVCGKPLFSSCYADIEDMSCPKCKSVYSVKITEGSLLIKETTQQYNTAPIK